MARGGAGSARSADMGRDKSIAGIIAVGLASQSRRDNAGPWTY
jgi:hypothetical protein